MKEYKKPEIKLVKFQAEEIANNNIDSEPDYDLEDPDF